ncbi:peptidylprolyl isomerase [Actinomadura pelletieri DSM 43383]|uniref:peptidylprolyl isomerase n=1 Tax=Actinomadura pelletieri DSM 43383 TaxID=1120940 RepID=A0A495QUB1_9ACTN|nr:FKBP-type peptidyl-prolyl cis-trans isomerase [Actinomadura pelletieri]RKS77090.1 peptidylprolyl isomerase [Actinomadura pelletieri DSM 43383]
MSEDDKPGGKPAIKAKAKIPNAKNIRSPEFTPHGISAGRGSGLSRRSTPSALTAKKARQRRMMMIAGAVAVAVAVAGVIVWWANRPGPKIEVSGKFGVEPKVKIPTDLAPAGERKVTVPIRGTGQKIANGDTLFAQYTFYQWSKDKDVEDSSKKSKNKQIGSSYQQEAQGQPTRPLIVGKSGIKGFDQGMVGQTSGSRVVLQIPPSQGFGKEAEQLGLAQTDWVVFVVDIQAVVPKNTSPQGVKKPLNDKKLPKVEDQGAGKAPKVTIPKDEDAPDKLQVKTLVEGTGPALAKGDEAVVHYQGRIWKTGKEFDSSWAGEAPSKFAVGTGATVPGFDKGLTGAKIGSRLLLILPPKEGYGEKGNPQAGIKGDDTLVFVIDVIDKIKKK